MLLKIAETLINSNDSGTLYSGLNEESLLTCNNTEDSQ